MVTCAFYISFFSFYNPFDASYRVQEHRDILGFFIRLANIVGMLKSRVQNASDMLLMLKRFT